MAESPNTAKADQPAPTGCRQISLGGCFSQSCSKRMPLRTAFRSGPRNCGKSVVRVEMPVAFSLVTLSTGLLPHRHSTIGVRSPVTPAIRKSVPEMMRQTTTADNASSLARHGKRESNKSQSTPRISVRTRMKTVRNTLSSRSDASTPQSTPRAMPARIPMISNGHQRTRSLVVFKRNLHQNELLFL